MSPDPMLQNDAAPWLHVADRCYWAILHEHCPTRQGRKDRQRLDFAFEGELPMPIEQVLTAYDRIDDKRTLACAIDRSTAEAALESGAVVLQPCEPPEFVQEGIGDTPNALDQMNFLIGDATPRTLRRSRVRFQMELAALLLLFTTMLLFGMQRRIDESRLRAYELATQRQLEIERAIPNARVPDALSLLSELRRFERSRSADAMPPGFEPNRDITPSLAEALSTWPSDLHARTRRLVATADQIQIQTEVEAIEQSESLAQALTQKNSWITGVPRVESQTRGGFIAAITLNAAREETP